MTLTRFFNKRQIKQFLSSSIICHILDLQEDSPLLLPRRLLRSSQPRHYSCTSTPHPSPAPGLIFFYFLKSLWPFFGSKVAFLYVCWCLCPLNFMSSEVNSHFILFLLMPNMRRVSFCQKSFTLYRFMPMNPVRHVFLCSKFFYFTPSDVNSFLLYVSLC